MTNEQLIAVIGCPAAIISLGLMFFKFYSDAKFEGLYKYLDAKFLAVDNRFTIIENGLRTASEHDYEHQKRISQLEVK